MYSLKEDKDYIDPHLNKEEASGEFSGVTLASEVETRSQVLPISETNPTETQCCAAPESEIQTINKDLQVDYFQESYSGVSHIPQNESISKGHLPSENWESVLEDHSVVQNQIKEHHLPQAIKSNETESENHSYMFEDSLKFSENKNTPVYVIESSYLDSSEKIDVLLKKVISDTVKSTPDSSLLSEDQLCFWEDDDKEMLMKQDSTSGEMPGTNGVSLSATLLRLGQHAAKPADNIDVLKVLVSRLHSKLRNQGKSYNQHHLKRIPAHRKVATSQTSELVGKAPKTCNSYPDAIFK